MPLGKYYPIAWERLPDGHYLSHDADYKIVRTVYRTHVGFELFHGERFTQAKGVEWIRVPGTFSRLLKEVKQKAEELKWSGTAEHSSPPTRSTVMKSVRTNLTSQSSDTIPY